MFSEIFAKQEGGTFFLCVLFCSVLLYVLILRVNVATRRRRIPHKETLYILVTGCADGIGKALVDALLNHLVEKNIFVIGLDVASVEYKHDRFKAFKVDVRKESQYRPVVKFIKKEKIEIDGLCLCAGITATGPLCAMSSSTIQRVLDVNVMGVVKSVQHIIPHVKKEGNAFILPILSEIAFAMSSSAFNGPYAMSKFALEAYVVALRQELSLEGVDVIGCYPGAVQTKLALSSTLKASVDDLEGYAPAFKNFVKASSQYISTNSVPASHIADKVAEVCIYKTRGQTKLLINISTAMYILKFLPQTIMDFLSNSLLRRKR